MNEMNFCQKCGCKLNSKEGHWVCGSCNQTYYKNPIVGVAGILVVGNKILLGKRKGSYAGKWCIPCGYVDYEESVENALRREFFEETNLVVKTIKLFEAVSNFHNSNQHTVGIYYLIESEGVDLSYLKAKDDLLDVKFFNLDSIPINEMAFQNDLLVINKVKKEVSTK